MTEPLSCTFAVTDTEGFSGRTNPQKLAWQSAGYAAAEEAFAAAGIDPQDRTTDDRGDGALYVLPSPISRIAICETFVSRFASALRERRSVAGHDEGPRIRLALHHGDAHRSEHGWVGADVDLACGLADSHEVREVLRAARRADLVVVASERFYEAVVRHGYGAIDPAAWAPIRVHVKGVPHTAWVHVPGYPHPPLPPQEIRGAAGRDDDALSAAVGRRATVRGNLFFGEAHFNDAVAGDKHVHDERDHR